METIQALEMASENPHFPLWLRAACKDAAVKLPDAERYRWLRHGDNDERCIEFGKNSRGTRDDVWLLRGEKLDAAIDTAMSESTNVCAADVDSDVC